MEVGLVRHIDIDDEMQQSYLDYAMSVIVSRAIPDARDGLKPVHRRIMYAMHSMGIRPDSSFKKSARIVGEVLGKFHPHGDMAVYDAMARMAQDFAMRYPLVEGQGNFGSIDGDPPAAMRYTEARMAALAMEMMQDINKDTVDFGENFDGSLDEPQVLPCGFPSMLVNGATGIAVGMSTSIPPHNMHEVCDALIFMLNNWSKHEELSLDDLMSFIQGPDFPTGGIIVRGKSEDGDALSKAYASGRGKITLQARAHLEEMGRGRTRIIVTELPYQTNKAKLIERIADLARSGKLEGITDLRDESDRQGMRIVIELTKTANPEAILTTLYKRTPMQGTFSIIMLALVGGEPRLLSLKQSLRVYLEHRFEVVKRRSVFDLERARERAHILEGLRVALKNLDEVIRLIRSAKDVEQARARLMRKFKLSEIQATAILDMPLRRLASLERKKIEIEYKELQAQIKKLETLLRSEKKIRQLIATELEAIKATYGDQRRTHIVEAKGKGMNAPPLTAKDLVQEKDIWVVMTPSGHISHTPTARLPRISGRNTPTLVIGAKTRDTLYLFSKQGEGIAIAVHTLPECTDPDEGAPLASVSAFDAKVEIAAGVALAPDWVREGEDETFILFTSHQGMVKKSTLESLPGPSASTFQGVIIGEDDALGWVEITTGKDEILLASRRGMAIRFSEADVRPMGLSAAGVYGMRLEEEDDRIVVMGKIQSRAHVFLISETGLAKRTKLTEFPTQGRYGKGVLAWKSGSKDAIVGGGVGQPDLRMTARLAKAADRSVRLGDAPAKPRATAGNQLFPIREGDYIDGVSPVIGRPEIERKKKAK